jgi:hypothetical protein
MGSFRAEVTKQSDGSSLVIVHGAITAETAGPLSETLLGLIGGPSPQVAAAAVIGYLRCRP